MHYVSTRGLPESADKPDFADVLLTGLAPDGGLYVPALWPHLSAATLARLAGMSYVEAATDIMAPFTAGSIAPATLRGLVETAVVRFRHQAVLPLRQLDRRLWLLELFHGPTLAFKDVALQLLGHLFDHVLTARSKRVTIIGATSGDTGSAAIEACRDREAIDIFILYPQGRVSDVQERQMTTVASGNVHTLAVDGTFDDCQDLVKAMFNDLAFREALQLAAINSINWARVMAQTVYYATSAAALGSPGRPVSFVVPSGNFGNVYAGYVARAMGVPISQFLVGSNSNDILTRFLEQADLSTRPVVPTLSPSMDIQIPSNFERLLFDLFDRDGAAITDAMQRFRREGRLDIGPDRWRKTRRLFRGTRLDDAATVETMRTLYRRTGTVLDPHSAIAVAAAQDRDSIADSDPSTPLIALATAHPAKFPDAVEQAIGQRPSLPPFLEDLFDRPQRQVRLPADLTAVKDYVRANSRVAGSA